MDGRMPFRFTMRRSPSRGEAGPVKVSSALATQLSLRAVGLCSLAEATSCRRGAIDSRLGLLPAPRTRYRAMSDDFSEFSCETAASAYNCLVVCGPTASGKTALGVQLALDLGGEILSADSRQVYRGMDIGTGKDLHEYAAPPALGRSPCSDPPDAWIGSRIHGIKRRPDSAAHHKYGRASQYSHLYFCRKFLFFVEKGGLILWTSPLGEPAGLLQDRH